MDNVKEISCGYIYVQILKNDNTVWCCGGNDSGQLGLGDRNNRTTFTQVPNMDNVKDVICGDSCTFIIKNDNTVWCCGYNDQELLGPIHQKYKNFNKQNIDNIKKVYFNYDSYYILILQNDSTLWAKGANWYGELNTGDYDKVPEFIKISDDVEDVMCISKFNYQTHLIITKNDGTIWGCGSNWCGELGLGDNIDYTLTFLQINIDNVKKIYSGGEHTIIIKNDNTVWCCGYNGAGQLGLGDRNNRTTFTQVPNMDNVKDVICGDSCTFIIKNDNTVWCCGYNGNGQLGLGDYNNRNTFTQVPNMDNVKDVICGDSFTFIIKNDNTVWCCGYNGDGQLGLGDRNIRTTFTQVPNMDNVKDVICGDSCTFIIKNDNTVWCCGDNSYGQLGLGDYNNRTTFTKIDYISTVGLKCIRALDETTVMIFNDGTAYFTGDNCYNMSGLHQSLNASNKRINKFTKYELPNEFDNCNILINNEMINVEHGTCGYSHEVLISEDGRIFIRGNNEYGQLGLGDYDNREDYIELDESIKHIKAFKEVTVIKKHGKYYVAGKYVGNEFTKYDL